MDFISNLIKRPISLVLNETSTAMDKYPISASLPNTPSELQNKNDLAAAANGEQKQQINSNHKRPLSMSFSYNDDNMTDFIGVPEEFLDEFKDILPPPPFSLQNSNSQAQSLLDIDITRSLSITPPPPQPLTPAMKASQTIDEILSQINDNLQQAGLNDDVLAIASPPNNSELSPLSSKAALNNSKLLSSSSVSNTQQQNSSKITAAGSATSSVFENNSSPHKLSTDTELKTGQTFDFHKQQHAIKGQLNNSGFNKFAGLTEFDETKIPELPGDLNPNIEEQYNLTFEECFIPTLKTQQTTTVRDDIKVDKSNLLLPNESDVTSSDNETFIDCEDEKDPLASTYTEAASLDVTELESFQSAANKSLNSNFNNTMENIAGITTEAESQPLGIINQIEIIEQRQNEHVQPQVEPMDEDEPMDIDMDATLEMVHDSANNIQHIEKVLQHAENVLQHLEDKKALELANTENISDLSKQQTKSSEISFGENIQVESSNNNNQQEEVHQSKGELSKNISMELPVNKAETKNSELIENFSKDVSQDENDSFKQSKIESSNNLNSSRDAFNSSIKSASDSKSEKKLNCTLGSQKISPAPNSPSFPIKTARSDGFPRSPKAKAKSPFLEKSDYIKNNYKEIVEEKPLNNANGVCEQFSPNSVTNNLNGNLEEPALPAEENNKHQTFGTDTLIVETSKEQQAKISNEDKMGSENRRTFLVKMSENATPIMQFPSIDKPENSRRTFVLNTSESIPNETISTNTETDMNSRRTFNMLAEEFTPKLYDNIVINTSFAPMEVDDQMSLSSTLPTDEEQKSQSPLPVVQQNSQSPPLPSVQKGLQSSLPVVDRKSESPSHSIMKQGSELQLPNIETNAEGSLQRSQSHLPTAQPRSQSPPLPTIQAASQPPPLTTMPSQSPILTNQTGTQSSPPRITTHSKSETPPTRPELDSPEVIIIKEEIISPLANNTSIASQPLPTFIKKRPSIRDARVHDSADILSAKEQSNTKAKDEKDIFVEKHSPSPIEDIYTAVTATSTTLSNSSGLSEYDDQTSISCRSMITNGEKETKPLQIDDDFSGNNLILNPSDFDYLLTKGNNNAPVNRSSLLLKFDPLLGVPVPVNQGQQQLQQLQIPTNTNNPYLSPTIEEEEDHDTNRSFVIDIKPGASAKQIKERSQELKQQSQSEKQVQQIKPQLPQEAQKKNATMSADVIKDMSLDNDCNKTFENSNSTQSDDKQINYKMDELEKKIKNEVLKTEDIEKKLKDAEQREEALIKRITEKDKSIAKMTGVIEAYEKAIAELIADKEQLTQHYEKQLAEVKADRDSNYHHLTSLETTFSDLHVKYEKSKEMTCQLKESEEALQAEKRKNLENLHLQEQRYDKMKNHAMQQLEIANKKLESLTREHSIEITKLKALLKKEEIARSSINEQLAHKTKENVELVKICDELISGQGIS